MKTFILIAIMLIMSAVHVDAHEYAGKKHASTGHCYGWEITGDNMRICYTNEEQTKGKVIIYSHAMWHVGEEFDITEEEEE